MVFELFLNRNSEKLFPDDSENNPTLSYAKTIAAQRLQPLLQSPVWSGLEWGALRKSHQKVRAPKSAGLGAGGKAKSVVATGTVGMPNRFHLIGACRLHVVQEPQSASASITASQLATP